MNYTLGLDDIGATDQDLVGGKAANLGRMSQAGFRVPAAFTVTTAAYRETISESGILPAILALLDGIDAADLDGLESATGKIRELIMAAPVSESIISEITKGYAGLGDEGYVAVRSSGTAEDLADMSFAGQHDTYLHVRGEDDVIEAVKRCWASLWTARAASYRKQHGIGQESVALAVVVQTMIDAEVSGVLFTANPLNAATDEIVINASYGLGEGIVSGILEPDQLVIGHRPVRLKRAEIGSKQVQVVRDPATGRGVTTVPVSEADRSRQSLDEPMWRAIALLGKRVQGYYGGMPQDIEWAFLDGELYLLQARDITGVVFSWDEELELPTSVIPESSEDIVWSRGWGDMVTPGSITPLSYAIRYEIGHLMHRNVQNCWDTPHTAVHRVWRYHRARLYYNPAVDYENYASFCPPAFRTPELMLFVPDAQKDALLKEEWSWPKLMKAITRASLSSREQRPWEWKSHYEEMARVSEAFGLTPDQLTELDDHELKNYLDSRLVKQREWWESVWAKFFFSLPTFTSILMWMVKEWYGGDNVAMVADLVTGLPEKPGTLRENVDLWELSELIRNSPELYSVFQANKDGAFFAALENSAEGQAFLDRYRVFLGEHGHRGHGERDMHYARRTEDPAIDYANFKVLLSGDSARPDALFDGLIAKREAAQADMESWIRKQPLAPLKVEAFRLVQNWLLKMYVLRDDERYHTDRITMSKKYAVLEIGRRLEERGVLSGEDIWFFSKEELYRLLDGAPRTRLVEAKLAGRRANWERVRGGYTPPLWLKDNDFVELDQVATRSEDGVWVGKPMSQGEITGTARVIRRQQEIGRVNKGDIMICDSTDPGWTPVFLAIGGVVVQTGGLLSHAACISREYGLPAVQLPGAIDMVEDGATITVNGNNGTVTLVSNAVAASAEDHAVAM